MDISIIAVGNAGYNIANDIIEGGIIVPEDYIVCDSNASELQNKGLGTKCRPVMLQPFEGTPNTNKISVVSGIVSEDAELIVLCAGMGGHTGSRYAPLIGMDAQRKNKIVISIYATAFNFEGEEVRIRSKWGFLQQQIASDFCLFQDNNFIRKDALINDMNKPLIDALKILEAKSPIAEWPKLSTFEFKEVIIETAQKAGFVMSHNFYSKEFTDQDNRESMFNEIIGWNTHDS